jgi:hypothetical protein
LENKKKRLLLHPLSETESTQDKKFYTNKILNHPQEPRDSEVERGAREKKMSG